MSAPFTAKAIKVARERMAKAAALLAEAVDELRSAQTGLRATDDFARTNRARVRVRSKAMTEAYWLHNCIKGVLEDSSVEESPTHVAHDVEDYAASMVAFVAEEKRVLEGRARRAA